MLRLLNLVLAYGSVPLAAFLTGPILARVLGPVGRGELAAAGSVIFLGTVVFACGLPDAAAYCVGRFRYTAPGFLTAVGKVVIVASIGGAVIVAFLAGPISGDSYVTATMLSHYSWVLIPLVLMEILRGTAQGAGRVGMISLEQYTSSFGRLTVIAILALVGALTPTTAFLATFGCAVSAGLFLLSCRNHGADDGGYVGGAGHIKIWSMSGKFWFTAVAMQTNFRLDQAILLPLVGAFNLGIYAVAASVAQILTTLAYAVRSFAYRGLVSGGDIANVLRLVRLTLFGLLLLVGLVSAVSSWFIEAIFGAAFLGSVPPLLVLLAATIPISVNSMLSVCLIVSERVGIIAAAELSAVVVTVVGVFALAPGFGIMGAAVTSLLAYSGSLGVSFLACRRVLKVRVADVFSVRMDDIRWVASQFGQRTA